jgi:TonB family protein
MTKLLAKMADIKHMMVNVGRSAGKVLTTRRVVAVLVMFLGTMVALAQDEPKKVSRAESIGAAVTKVTPEYPPFARQLKMEGVVELEAVVTETGAVEKVNIVSGNPVLTKPAAEALKKWKFNPFQSDGKAVKALAQVSMSFKL